MSDYFLFVLIYWLFCAVMGAVVGEQKQATSGGFWFGFLLGPFGVIAAGFLDRRPLCAECGGRLNVSKDRWFAKCQHCGAAQPRPAVEPTWDEHLNEAGKRLREAIAGKNSPSP